jgi:oligopeptide/dipeptide ABC transporter ATP-binding protein
VGFQINEAMSAHERFSRSEARARVVPMLEKVRIPAAKQRAKDFPHQFSGGMRQRAMIAMGLSNEPDLIIADEPTTALDVTVQAQIIELLRDLNKELGTAIVLITHNLAVVASLCTRVLVMYAGRIVESGSTRQIFKSPQHPYTWSLLQSIPRIDAARHDKLLSIAGMPPDMTNLPGGALQPRRAAARGSGARAGRPLLGVLMRNALAGDVAGGS